MREAAVGRRSSVFGWSGGILGGLIGIGIGLACAAVIGAASTPAPLAHPLVGGVVQVEPAPFDDARTVELSLTLAPSAEVTVGRDGVLTSTTCVPGAVVESGKTVAAISGQRVVALATGVPAWRTISVGASGTDVLALSNELARLKLLSATSETASDEMVRAAAKLAGLPSGAGSIPAGTFAWIPAPTVTWSTCAVATGRQIAAGSALGSLRAQIIRAEPKSIPEHLAAGVRTLSVGGKVLANDNGRVTDASALAGLANSEAYQAYLRTNGQAALTATWRLATPLAVVRVPAGAVVTRAGAACVFVSGRPVQVSVVASELGKSLIAAPIPALASVDFPLPSGAACP